MFTIRFLIDTYGWDKCIEVFGWDEWFLNEGRALDTDTQSVTEEQLLQLQGRKTVCSMHANCTMMYIVSVDDEVVMRTDNHDAAFKRIKYEAEVNKNQGLHNREITLKVEL